MSLFKPRSWPFWHHQLIRLQWRRWLVPTLLMLPYAASLIWFKTRADLACANYAGPFGDGSCYWSHYMDTGPAGISRLQMEAVVFKTAATDL